MGEAKDKERQCVFGLSYEGQAGDPNRIPVVVVGIPLGAWAYIADGKTHNFDLSKAGVPVKLVMFGAPTRAAAMEMIISANEANGRVTLDATQQDFSIAPIDKPAEEGEADQP